MENTYLAFRVVAFIGSVSICFQPEYWLNVGFWWLVVLGIIDLALVLRVLHYRLRTFAFYETLLIVPAMVWLIRDRQCGNDEVAAIGIGMILVFIWPVALFELIYSICARRQRDRGTVHYDEE